MIDTHAHLHLIDRPLDDILSAAKHAGVQHIIQVAIDVGSIQHNVSLYAGHSMCSITAGIHPLSVDSVEDFDAVIRLLRDHMDDIVAIGEIGLDYKYGGANIPQQVRYFKAQMDLAAMHQKPVIIHSRYADNDMLAIVNAYPQLKKVFHCYATHIDFFDALEGDQNYVSFTGMITYAKKGKVIRALKQVPLNRLMLETDAPYMVPKGIDANQNSPEYVGHIADAIAHHRDMSREELISKTTQNAHDFFKLPH